MVSFKSLHLGNGYKIMRVPFNESLFRLVGGLQGAVELLVLDAELLETLLAHELLQHILEVFFKGLVGGRIQAHLEEVIPQFLKGLSSASRTLDI